MSAALIITCTTFGIWTLYTMRVHDLSQVHCGQLIGLYRSGNGIVDLIYACRSGCEETKRFLLVCEGMAFFTCYVSMRDQRQ